jgi:hypothetical protein
MPFSLSTNLNKPSGPPPPFSVTSQQQPFSINQPFMSQSAQPQNIPLIQQQNVISSPISLKLSNPVQQDQKPVQPQNTQLKQQNSISSPISLQLSNPIQQDQKATQKIPQKESPAPKEDQISNMNIKMQGFTNELKEFKEKCKQMGNLTKDLDVNFGRKTSSAQNKFNEIETEMRVSVNYSNHNQ